MGFKQRLSKATGISAAKLPSSYQIVGDVLLFKLPKLGQKQKEKIASSVLTLLPYVKTVCEMKEVGGELREPQVTKIAGASTLTTHKENGILYKLDVSQVMFSKGNLSERKRLIPLVKGGERVVDMFVGIGYFSLGISKFTGAGEILAIEKNPVAYNYFTDNIELNKAANINAMQGDCKTAALSFREYADRIIMGYFPGTEEFLPYALFMARDRCIVHFHNICRAKDIWKKPAKQISDACGKAGVGFKILAKKKVKSYAPNTWHVVVDFEVSKNKPA